MRETSTHAHFSSRIVQKRATKYLGPLIPGATAYMCQCVRVRMCVRDLQSRPYYGVVRHGASRQENRGRAGLHTPTRHAAGRGKHAPTHPRTFAHSGSLQGEGECCRVYLPCVTYAFRICYIDVLCICQVIYANACDSDAL